MQVFYSSCHLLARALQSDALILTFVGRVLFAGRPQARKMLQYYLHGGGAPQSIDVDALLREDIGVRSALAAAMAESDTGSMALPQWRFANRTWRYALGSVRLSWTRRADVIELTLESSYDWHPDEFRVTRRVHQAAARMKAGGAAAFRIEGTACIGPGDVQVSQAWIPRDCLFL